MRNVPRIETTLLLLVSVDGKITSGASDDLDPDKDWKRIHGVKDGLHQYYELEESIAIHSLNTGRVMAKIGVNTHTDKPEKDEHLTFVILDHKPHLDANGIRYLAQRAGRLLLVTDNSTHPAFSMQSECANLKILYYPTQVELPDLFRRLKQEHGIRHLTIESGGTLNAALLRQGLIDHIVLVVAPLLVGGKDTPSPIDGISSKTEQDLVHLKALKLVRCQVLENSYLRLEYDVINDTVIEPPTEQKS